MHYEGKDNLIRDVIEEIVKSSVPAEHLSEVPMEEIQDHYLLTIPKEVRQDIEIAEEFGFLTELCQQKENEVHRRMVPYLLPWAETIRNGY